MIIRFISVLCACLALASFARAHGGLEEAISAVSSAIEKTPGDADLFLRRAELHRLHGSWSVALADYARARKLRPSLDVVNLGIAQMHVARGRDRAAVALLDRFVAAHPDSVTAFEIRARALERRGNWRAAERDLAVAGQLSREPHFTSARAELLERHGETDAALRCLDETSRARGRLPALERQALAIETRAGRVGAALRRLDDFALREPRADAWHAEKAALLENAGRAADAQAEWKRADAALARMPQERRETRAARQLATRVAEALSKNPGGAP